METCATPIAVVQGAASAVIQRLLADFAARWNGRIRIAGLVEEAQQDACNCAPGRLRSLVDGSLYPIFQDLGPGSVACALDAVSLVAACEAVRRDIAAGCDLVILSKFGKLEAESRSGLLPAFADAIEAGIPILTAVAPKFDDRWQAFAAPLDVRIPATSDALDGWWQQHG
ncbi:MAG: DUF2478 domain-containing protein [Sphingomonadales bacterium]|nr:DUF2478 domain-containing protein [Sphingomonadales bacterium]